jgi:hypothetical protein
MSSDRASDELARTYLDNLPLRNEILEGALKIHGELSTNPEGFVDEYQRDGSGRGFVLEALPRHDEFALWVQFTIFPLDRLVEIVRVELLGPSPPSDRADGHSPS